jgi:hypothetical protein
LAASGDVALPPGDSLETYVGVVYEGVDAFKIVSLPVASSWPLFSLMARMCREFVIDIYTIMQAAIKDVKRKFTLKMQLAITCYLPGSYRL